MEHLLYEKKDHVGILTINRPRAMNALNSAVVMELKEVLAGIADSDIRCLIIVGAGSKAFVAGADIAEMKDLTPEGAKAFSNAGNAVMEAIENLAMPVIAAVNGYALGGGCELAMSCDIRIASENAVFGLPEVSLGVVPGYGGIQRMARIIGPAVAKELVYTTNRINAQQALTYGLVNAVCPQNELMQTCMSMAERISANAPFAVQRAKSVFNRCAGLTLEDSYRLETTKFADCFTTDDRREAMSAFVEKRKPQPFIGK